MDHRMVCHAPGFGRNADTPAFRLETPPCRWDRARAPRAGRNVMQVLRINWLAVGAAALLGVGVTSSAARAEDDGSRVQVSVLGGVQNLNMNDTALPDNFVNIPAGATLSYDFSRNWGVEGEFAWLIPVKQSADVGVAGSQDRKTPNVLSYQGSVIGRL